MTDTIERIEEITEELRASNVPSQPYPGLALILIARMEEEIARNGGGITVRIMPDGLIWMVRTSEDDYFNESRIEATFQAWLTIQEQQQ